MENASKALIIAGSVLVSCVIIAIIVFVFNRLSSYQKAQDEVVYRDSITEFNKSFLAYDKSLMYGTDVLSCLNLAENNNQQYVYNVYYGTDTKEVTYAEREELMVQVHVTLNTALEEEITISTQTSSGSLSELTASQCESYAGNSGGYLLSSKKLFATSSSEGLFTLPSVKYYYFSGGSGSSGSSVLKVVQGSASYADLMWSDDLRTKNRIKTSIYTTTIAAGEYNLVADNIQEATDTAQLIALLSTVTNIEQVVYNSSYSGTGDWYMASWVSAAYDFKTRKFVCTGMEYNDNGYISEIWFAEYPTS